MKRIAYMIPEYPSQTHTFFYREMRVLRKNNIQINVISTVRPGVNKASKSHHDWTENAVSGTYYLHPPVIADLKIITYVVLNIVKVIKCLILIISSEDSSVKEKLKLFLTLPYAIKFAKYVKQKKLEHIHSHFCYRASDIAFFASILASVTYSISRHGPNGEYSNQINKWSHASFCTVITKIMLSELDKSPLGEFKNKIKVISMGVETERFFRKTNYLHPHIENIVKIFCCARINPSKGQKDLIILAEELKNIGINVDIRIAGGVAGNRSYFKELQNLVKESTSNIQLLGSLSESEIISELEKCHLFVLPSRSEPLGVAYMEAMSMELPVIAYNSGGVKELIHNKKNGFLCADSSIKCLVNTVKWIIENPTETERIRKQARSSIIKYYDSSVGALSMLKAFQEL
jgi:colanic acid/amylovoran biosynthesis glycosyltransferase